MPFLSKNQKDTTFNKWLKNKKPSEVTSIGEDNKLHCKKIEVVNKNDWSIFYSVSTSNI